MGAHIIQAGESAHQDEADAIRFLAEGLPSSATVFTNPMLATPQGALFELDAVVAMPHAVFIVEIKSHHGQVRAGLRDWVLNDGRTLRSPLLLGRKTVQVLHSALARKSYESGRVWVQEITFLPNVSRVEATHAVASRVATRDTLHALLTEPERVHAWANRRVSAQVTPQTVNDLMRILELKKRPARVTSLAHFTITDTLDAHDRYTEYLATSQAGQQQRVLRYYRRPWQSTDAHWQAIKKKALWEAGILQSLDRAPPELGLPRVDPAIATDDGVIVPMEYFAGLTLPEWVAQHGRDLSQEARVALWRRIVRTVAYLHERGIVHRHLGAHLVLVRSVDDAQPEFRVTGFDLAKRADSTTTIASSGVSADRLEGAAPEVVHALSDGEPRSDQFSLGLILALLLLGEPLVPSTLPYVEDNQRLPYLRERNPKQSRRLDEAVATMVHARATSRFPSLGDAMAAVAEAVEPVVTASRDPLAPGSAVGPDYVIVDKVGSGGLADVYQVKHRLLPQRRVFKIARTNPTAELALRREHAALQLFDHPQVVRAHDLTSMVEGRITLVLDFISGGTLADFAATIASGDTHTRRRLAEDLFTALDVFEQMDLAHNDLKPENLMVTEHGRLVAIDFSLADGPSLREHDKAPLGGTQKWRDPATRRGHAADRYAAAMCLFWLHSGRHPFDGTVPEPDVAPDIHPHDLDPPGLVAFFTKALHPEPSERYSSAAALRDAYLTALGAAVPGLDAVSTADLATATPLSQTALPQRAVRSLNAARVRTVGHLLSLTDAELSRIHGIGHTMVTHLRAFADRALRAGITPQPLPTGQAAPPFFAGLIQDPTPLTDLALDAGLLTALTAAQLTSVGAVARSTRSELSSIAGVGPKTLVHLAEQLVKHTNAQASAATPLDTLDAVWERAIQPVGEDDARILAHYVGLVGPGYATQGELAKALGTNQPAVSQAKNRALQALDRSALAPLFREVDALLDASQGIALLDAAAATLTRALPAAALNPVGAFGLVCALNTEDVAIYEDLDVDVPSVLVRPRWFSTDLLRSFLRAAQRLASWPPTPMPGVRSTLKMLLPDYRADPVDLADRLLVEFCLTRSGDVFLPPVDLADAVTYALHGEVAPVPLHTLPARLTQAFGEHAPTVPDAVILATRLNAATQPTCPFTVAGDAVVRRDAPAPEPSPLTTADIKGVLAIAEHESEDTVVARKLLGAAQSGASFRLVVAAPAHDVAIGRSIHDALAPHTDVVLLDLAHEWFTRHAATLSRDARAHRLAPLRKVTAAAMNALMTELIQTHGKPGRTVVLYRTGLLHTLGALEEVRLTYTRVQGGGRGLWVFVIPGTVVDAVRSQPLFNGEHETWRMPGQVLPLNHPLAPDAVPPKGSA